MKMLPERETERLLKKYGIPVPENGLARTEQEAVSRARKIGFPVVMKVSSPDIIHKTDADCVIVNVRDPAQARAAFRQIRKNARKAKPRARVRGVRVFEMVPPGTREVIVGGKHDPQFGPVLMFGLGGIFVEVLRDVAFRIVPLEARDARELVREIRGFKVLEGVRGKPQVNFRALERTILKVSRMMEREKRIQELDINPLFVDEEKVWAADVRILA